MAKILAIDTSTNACSVAIANGEKIQEAFKLEPQSHTQSLLPMVDQLLAEQQLSLSALDAIALTVGPGSFTGLRIGLGIVQGLAFGADLPVIGESSLQVMSASAQRLLQPPECTYLLPSFDARMQEIYWACYRSTPSLDTIIEDTVSAPESKIAQLTKLAPEVLGVGDGWRCVNSDLLTGLNINPDFYPHAYDLARLAIANFEQGRIQSATELQPVYIRNEVHWKKRQKIRRAPE